MRGQLIMQNLSDNVQHPPHYTSHPSGVECIQVAEHMGFNLGNVIKYVWRADSKGAPIEDLEKAKWYLEREIARRYAKAGAEHTDNRPAQPNTEVLWVSNNRCKTGARYVQPHPGHSYGAKLENWCDGSV